MDMRLLEYFLAVVEAGNISKAALKLHVTQPTLTRQLQQLEEYYGSQLFIRGSRKMTLTNSGIILKKRALELLDLQTKTKMEIKQNEHEISGVLTIGCGESCGNQFLPIILKEFSKQYPKVTYQIKTAGSSENEEKIEDGLIDVAIVLGPIDKNQFHSLSLPYQDHWCLLMKKDSPLAQRKRIYQEDLKDLPLAIANRKEVLETFYDWADNPQMPILYQYNLNSNLIILVENGLCYGITIDGAVDNRLNQSLTYRILEPQIVYTSYLIWKKGVVTNPILEKFILCAQKIIHQPDRYDIVR